MQASEDRASQHMINFSSVKASELIRFMSRVTKTNFIFREKDLDFEVTFISGKDSSNEQLLSTLITLLEHHHFKVRGKGGSYVIEKALPLPTQSDEKSASQSPPSIHFMENEEFFVYKLQYHKGSEILEAIKQLAASAQGRDPQFVAAVQSMQWLQATNSLVVSGSTSAIQKLLGLIRNLDTPQKQVFIEVLVVETDMGKSSEFGLNWTVGSKYKNRLNIGMSNTGSDQGALFGDAFKSMPTVPGLQGLSHLPSARGFDLGVIGDIIMHKGMTFFSLGSLVSAIQTDHSSSIVLNQKVLAQDNKTSKIFVGRSIPFAGAVVETIGQSQQTTANIEYRDVGTMLNITPYIGENGVITMEIEEEISEASDRLSIHTKKTSGIETTKTNMVTRVHVPDSHFLVLTGMVRNQKKKATSGMPCLGGLPFIGNALSKNDHESEKRNLIIFVRPHILYSFEDYETLSNDALNQTKQHEIASDLIDEIILDPSETVTLPKSVPNAPDEDLDSSLDTFQEDQE